MNDKLDENGFRKGLIVVTFPDRETDHDEQEPQ